ncbi:MAG: D-alanyl-D-alanine carboxypeptidase [Oscillospiraceae bacterium]|nr:D-alanyl-D-alanine carboxypeptidase [Oscillospiraceae bacterium]
MKRMRKACLSVMCIIWLLMQCVGVPAAALQSDSTVASGSQTVDAAKALESQQKLVETAKAVVVYEKTSGTMVYTWNADGRIFPASMVKLMTALVALDNTDISQKVMVTTSALNRVPVGALRMGLVAGEELTLEQLLYCMMVASANDAAMVIAQHVAGSQEAFIAKMNEKARELGCTDTNFSNVHGLHDEQTYTTARDVCRILLAGLEDPRFEAMFTTAKYTIPATNLSKERTIKTTNNMMLTTSWDYYDQRVTGGRTGSTDAAGRCIAITAEASGMELVCVLMGAEPTYSEDKQVVLRFGSFEEMSEILDYVFDGYALYQLAAKGQIVTQLEVTNGANHVAVQPERSVLTVLPADIDLYTLRWEFVSDNLTAPVEVGTEAGAVQIWHGDICVGQTNLITANSVEVETTLVMPKRPSEMDGRGSWKILLFVVCGIAGVAVVVMLFSAAPKIIRRIKVKNMRRRRRKNRRRAR